MPSPALPDIRYEQELSLLGFESIAGVDEAGRGALAGPVVAAAAILPAGFDIPGIRDSKLIPEQEREELYEKIVSALPYWGVGFGDNEEIDRINIRQATLAAMARAVRGLGAIPGYVLIDGRDTPDIDVPSRAIISGDAISCSIAAASIIAKVTRDRIMRGEHARTPLYGFAQNKGYGTAVHRAALCEHGPCPIHRVSFLGKILQQQLFT